MVAFTGAGLGQGHKSSSRYHLQGRSRATGRRKSGTPGGAANILPRQATRYDCICISMYIGRLCLIHATKSVNVNTFMS